MPRLIVNDVAGGVNVPTAGPDAFGAGVGRGVQGLGEAVSQTARIFEAARATQARRQAAAFTVELQEAANAISLDPDLESRESKFEAERKRLTAQFRSGSEGIFDTQARLSGEQVGHSLRHKTRMDAIEVGQGDLEETLRIYANQFARSDDSESANLISMQADIAVDEAITSGLVNEPAAIRFRRQFLQSAMGGTLRRFQNEDPVAGLRFLETEFRGDEVERQVWRSHMVSAIRANANAELSEIRRQDALARRHKNNLAEEGERTLVELAFGEGFTEQDVMKHGAHFSPEKMSSMLAQARAGGKFIATQSNPVVYDALRSSAITAATEVTIGDETVAFRDAMRTALFNGTVTKTDFEALHKLSEDESLGRFSNMIRDAIAGSAFSGPAARVKAMEAEQDFINIVQRREEANNPMDSAEKRELVDRLIGSALLADTAGKRTFELLPLHAVKKTGSPDLDIPATIQGTVDALQSGEIGEITFAEQIERIEEFAEQQRILSERRASDAAAREASR